MYFGVPIVGTIGAAIARFRPYGMARALVATARSSAGPCNCADHLESPGYLLGAGCGACVRSGWVFRHAVCRIGVVDSESGARRTRTGRGLRISSVVSTGNSTHLRPPGNRPVPIDLPNDGMLECVTVDIEALGQLCRDALPLSNPRLLPDLLTRGRFQGA